MNIKSLLLGSAAALVAVSGARAADAVIAPEPEPVEYVRVCDIYGAGYYYIPGTEICLKVGGYIRYDIGVGDLFGETSAEGEDTYTSAAVLRSVWKPAPKPSSAPCRARRRSTSMGTGHRLHGVDADGDGIVILATS